MTLIQTSWNSSSAVAGISAVAQQVAIDAVLVPRVERVERGRVAARIREHQASSASSSGRGARIACAVCEPAPAAATRAGPASMRVDDARERRSARGRDESHRGKRIRRALRIARTGQHAHRDQVLAPVVLDRDRLGRRGARALERGRAARRTSRRGRSRCRASKACAARSRPCCPPRGSSAWRLASGCAARRCAARRQVAALAAGHPVRRDPVAQSAARRSRGGRSRNTATPITPTSNGRPVRAA